ncbi:oligopeptide transport system permease protein [Clostridium acetobutylicum]|uniref:Oligopeptide ABC transporter, permease component n=1 Tax=Clostridium acetobutylicum (strain ATCC 824 / DSM 792 / JCM 1419 / IAM 19013 / LMG 5710 / NBRC 13948 / NRRL B-527 / VKM B-1787 / 2291 / W) TaxID=272562 RepID=Q97D42_CLOAB|nr:MULTISPECIES: ABC transporter permease [Clostridium]AAK81561.1 Oligopeptide ABC transporter, permease component [Clostridium acetobutylicum ATCC 824]ADZ22682.1 Oligopeptide ABC transporter, permease component [Clostridium acetobutylicum EA 2018]AEI34336.1 oligopeptide ABC transporter, permease component [Clostridium acetobutylicum DSM 1731]AWV80766.1 ABC transporter permease [Clostridium acetobutylicum]KHD35491.1 peptide ABC transporter permease [Clostridium acetobutylicum]
MFRYIIKRFIASIVTLWIVVTFTFLLAHAIPGGPFTSEKKLPPAIEANLKAKFGLDKPLGSQYTTYLTNMLKGDLGMSMQYEGRMVKDIITYSFPNSAKLGAVAILFAVVVGVYLGAMSAIHQNKWQDGLSTLISTFGVTIPSFVLATLLIYLFSLKFKILPAVGFSTPSNYIMPALALGIFPMAFVTRYTRSMLIDVLGQDYIRTAKAKGLSKNIITYKHALKNSLIPVVTYLGPLIAGVLTGSFVVESIFGIPGLGREFVLSIDNRDYTTIIGVTVFFSAILILCNLIVDILYVIIDPRIKLQN